MAQRAQIGDQHARDNGAGPHAQRRMDGRCSSQQKTARAIRARGDQRHRKQTERQSKNAVRILGAQQKQSVDRPVLGRACEKDEGGGADRHPDISTERVDNHRQRLKGHHSQHAADHQREANFGNPQPEENRQQLVKDGPEFQVINEKRIARGIPDEAREDLAGFDGHLPVGEPHHSDAKSQEPADEQYPGDACLFCSQNARAV